MGNIEDKWSHDLFDAHQYDEKATRNFKNRKNNFEQKKNFDKIRKEQEEEAPIQQQNKQQSTNSDVLKADK